jgi:hypothetical protein
MIKVSNNSISIENLSPPRNKIKIKATKREQALNKVEEDPTIKQFNR